MRVMKSRVVECCGSAQHCADCLTVCIGPAGSHIQVRMHGTVVQAATQLCGDMYTTLACEAALLVMGVPQNLWCTRAVACCMYVTHVHACTAGLRAHGTVVHLVPMRSQSRGATGCACCRRALEMRMLNATGLVPALFCKRYHTLHAKSPKINETSWRHVRSSRVGVLVTNAPGDGESQSDPE